MYFMIIPLWVPWVPCGPSHPQVERGSAQIDTEGKIFWRPAREQHAGRTNGNGRPSDDREERPFALVSDLERATGIEPA
jgi:hypothetical protein